MKALLALIPFAAWGAIYGAMKYAAKRKAADLTEGYLKKRHDKKGSNEAHS